MDRIWQLLRYFSSILILDKLLEMDAIKIGQCINDDHWYKCTGGGNTLNR